MLFFKGILLMFILINQVQNSIASDIESAVRLRQLAIWLKNPALINPVNDILSLEEKFSLIEFE